MKRLNKRYSNGRYRTSGNYQAFKIMLASVLLCWMVTLLQPRQAVWADPRSDAIVIENKVVVEKIVEVEKQVYGDNMDEWVGEYTDKYFTGPKRSEVRMIMHCLLHRESGHGASNKHGDNGKAGGPLQFHQGTWDGYRKIMLKEGLITEIGSRYDMEQAIHTTIWAISTGRAKAWGPILRDSKGSNFASCQTPSWYKE